MVWIDAVTMIAFVANHKTSRYGAMHSGIHDSVKGERAPARLVYMRVSMSAAMGYTAMASIGVYNGPNRPRTPLALSGTEPQGNSAPVYVA